MQCFSKAKFTYFFFPQKCNFSKANQKVRESFIITLRKLNQKTNKQNKIDTIITKTKNKKQKQNQLSNLAKSIRSQTSWLKQYKKKGNIKISFQLSQ